MTGRVKTLAVLLMDREDSGVVEVTETSAAPMHRVVVRQICHEAPEDLDPRIVIVPEAEINDLLVTLLGHVERMTPLPLSAKKLKTLIATPSLSAIPGCLRWRLDNGWRRVRIVRRDACSVLGHWGVVYMTHD